MKKSGAIMLLLCTEYLQASERTPQNSPTRKPLTLHKAVLCKNLEKACSEKTKAITQSKSGEQTTQISGAELDFLFKFGFLEDPEEVINIDSLSLQ